MLTGDITSTAELQPDDFRARHPRFQDENLKRNLAVVDVLKKIATEKGITPSQLALAWLMHQGHDIVPIPGTKRRKWLEENWSALDVVLSKDELARINEASPAGAFAGQRYADMSNVNA